jgi:pimeloyl-ACP methyl ester carboxylesterase
MMEDRGRGRYAQVNGLNMYFEVHEVHGVRGVHGSQNAAKPLVLLHGGISNIETDFGKLLPAFAKSRQVIAIEQQGHGHTGDVDRPLRFEQMAEDTIAVLRHLSVANADFFGYSMGGGIALQIALRQPDLVHKLVFGGGASYSPNGLYPEAAEAEQKMKPEDLAGSPFQEAYAKMAPNPENWPVLIEKMKELDRSFGGWSLENIQAIQAPTLLIIGDSDIVRPEHTVQMFRLLGGGVPGDIYPLPAAQHAQLAVLPGTTHIGLVQRVDWLSSMVEAFLDAPMPS